MRPLRWVLVVFVLWGIGLLLAQLLACELASAREQRPAALPSAAEEQPSPTKQHRTLPAKATPDPYAGWKSWCEPEQLPTCKTASDCDGVFHPSGRPLKCIRPWYAERGSDLRVCSPGFSNRFERAHQRARLRELVRLQYSGESELCGRDGWLCTKSRLRGERLATLLSMVAQRETTMRHWKRHRLNGDVAMAKHAWERTAKLYGHERIKERRKKSEVFVGVRFHEGGNTHFRSRGRWEYGLGLYGMNAAYFTKNWSKAAPPEVLCREVEGTEAYLRAARRGWKKLSGGIDCDGKPGREWHGVAGAPTWYDVHHYASGGKLCPSKKSQANFERAAKKVGLPPFAKVSLAELGEPIDPDGQNATARLLLAQLDVYSTVWMAQQAANN